MKIRTNNLVYAKAPEKGSVKDWLEGYFGNDFLRWSDSDPDKGYVKCPYESGHGESNGPKDVAVFLHNRYPKLKCFHSSCRENYVRENALLKKAYTEQGGFKPRAATPEEKARAAKFQALEREKDILRDKCDYVFNNHKWTVADIKADSSPIKQPWLEYLELWNPDDVIWHGEKYDSSQPRHRAHFRTANEWASIGTAQYQLICASAFMPDSYQRSKDRVAARRFITVECDGLDPDPEKNKDMSGSVLRWLIEKHGWKLACVVDSGKKSIHGHFYIDSVDVDWATTCLEALGVDQGPLMPAQAVRAPGAIRDNGREQALIWKQ